MKGKEKHIIYLSCQESFIQMLDIRAMFDAFYFSSLDPVIGRGGE